MPEAFDFGSNWEAFSAAKLDAPRLHAAAQSLRKLIGAENIADRTFVDVGCGSGLFSIAAAQCGAARVVGFDVNPKAVEVSKQNVARFADHLMETGAPHFCVGDVLDHVFLAQLGTFDIVYAWGVLHHTGAMWQAVRNSASLVDRDGGLLVIAIYNRHWTSPIWRQIKRLYNSSPAGVRWLLTYVFGAAIYVGKWAITRENPLQKERGMDFWYDVIDWLGGYPYEYARAAEVTSLVQSIGFGLDRCIEPRVPTGCNEFVFRARSTASETVPTHGIDGSRHEPQLGGKDLWART